MTTPSQPIEPTTDPNLSLHGAEGPLHFGGETFILEDIQRVSELAPEWKRARFILRHEGTGASLKVIFSTIEGRMRVHTAIDSSTIAKERQILARIIMESGADIQEYFRDIAQICLGEA